MNRRWWALLLVIAAIATTVLVWRLRPQPQPRTEVVTRSDYILRDFELMLLDSDGQESFTVTGPLLERAPDGQRLELSEPRFSFPDPHAGRWLAQSRRAWVTAKADQVSLLDEVEFLGPATRANGQVRFRTERLDVFPDAQQARAPGAVTVTQSGSILRGVELSADMSAQRYQLSSIQGRYAPQRR